MKNTRAWPRLYASDQTHGWIEKGVELLGLGRGSIHRVASHADGTIRLDALQAAIDEDRRRGDQPWCLCANVGTVHTGAIDDLDRLAKIAKEQELWFHIDGAFGGLAVLVPSIELVCQPCPSGFDRYRLAQVVLSPFRYRLYVGPPGNETSGDLCILANLHANDRPRTAGRWRSAG